MSDESDCQKKTVEDFCKELEGSLESDILKKLSEYYHIPIIDLGEIEPDAEIVRLVDLETIRLHRVLPVRLEGDNLIVAITDPLDKAVIEAIQVATGYNVVLNICSPKALEMRGAEQFGTAFYNLSAPHPTLRDILRGQGWD